MSGPAAAALASSARCVAFSARPWLSPSRLALGSALTLMALEPGNGGTWWNSELGWGAPAGREAEAASPRCASLQSPLCAMAPQLGGGRLQHGGKNCSGAEPQLAFLIV